MADPVGSSGSTIAQVLATAGTRSPAFPDTQRDFTIGFIVVSERRPRVADFAYFHHVAAQYTRDATPLGVNWHVATGGRSRLVGELPAPSGAPAPCAVAAGGR